MGTLLAVNIIGLCALAVGFALLVHSLASKRKDAPKTAKTRVSDVVTHEELEAALQRHRDALEWEWTEMYDKFNKLHLRLTKRDQRKKRDQEELEDPQIELDERPRAPRSVLPFRKLGP